MHHIYHTEAVVLASRSIGESGKGMYLFTRDFGLVYAKVRGLRQMSSRLRFVLTDFSYIKVDLVRGRDVWRITSASKTNMLDTIKLNRKALRVFANLAQLLQRLLRGEENNPELFEDFIRGLVVLEGKSTDSEIAHIEIIMVLRILNNLGYIGAQSSFASLLRSPFEESMIYALPDKQMILREINRALRETQL